MQCVTICILDACFACAGASNDRNWIGSGVMRHVSLLCYAHVCTHHPRLMHNIKNHNICLGRTATHGHGAVASVVWRGEKDSYARLRWLKRTFLPFFLRFGAGVGIIREKAHECDRLPARLLLANTKFFYCGTETCTSKTKGAFELEKNTRNQT